MIYYKGRQIDEINAYNVEGTTLNNQSKEIEINKNGETIITYDEGYTGLEQVTVNVNVASQGGEGGNSFSVIGYPSAPQFIQDGIDYAKTIQDNWDASIKNRASAFSGDTELTYFPQVDTSNVTNMFNMFSGCTRLQYLPSIDTSNVTNMNQMFDKCYSLRYIGEMDTSKVTDMSYMFDNCKSLTSLDLSSFDTSNVTNMSHMFYNCDLSYIDKLDFNLSKVSKMVNMFQNSTFDNLDLSSWDLTNQVSSGISYGYMFNYATGNTLNLSNWKFQGNFNSSSSTGIGGNGTFFQRSHIKNIILNNVDTTNVTDMGFMFSYCYDVLTLDLSSLDTSNVVSMARMFENCENLTSLDLTNWDTSNVTSMIYMFYYCGKLERIDGYLDWSKISSYPTSFIYSSSSSGYPLRYMTIKNLGTTGDTFNFNNTYLQNWGDENTKYPLSVGARQSLVDSLLTYSYDRAANGLSNATIQLNSRVKARLTADEITAIQNKGYTIS